MKLLYRIIGIIYSLSIGTALWGWLLIKNKKTYYIICDPGIGDIIPTCGFLPAYRKKKEISHITVIGMYGKEEIYHMYENTYDDILFFSKKNYLGLLSVFPYDLGKVLLKSNRVISTRLGTHTRGEYIYRITTYLNAIRCGTYELKENDLLLPPCCDAVDISNIIKKFKIKQDNTVILNPYANTITGISLEFFEKLGMKLKEKGFQVITNLSNASCKPVYGTDGVVMSLSQAYQMADYCGYIIGLRSGWIDLMAFTNCRIVALYPNGYQYARFCDLSEVNCKLEDVVLNMDNKDMDRILELLHI